MLSAKPYGRLRYREIAGKRMALEGFGRLVACDLIGMGASEKLSPSGPDRYHYTEQRDYLFALPCHLAVLTRRGFVRAACHRILIDPYRIRLPSALSRRCDGRKSEVFHLQSELTRLTAHVVNVMNFAQITRHIAARMRTSTTLGV
jgi:hypothetical protein